MYPLVRELAEDGIPVTVTCRVLDLARQPYYRWLKEPVADTELREAKKRIRLLEQENGVLRRAAAYLSQANLPGE